MDNIYGIWCFFFSLPYNLKPLPINVTSLIQTGIHTVTAEAAINGAFYSKCSVTFLCSVIHTGRKQFGIQQVARIHFDMLPQLRIKLPTPQLVDDLFLSDPQPP